MPIEMLEGSRPAPAEGEKENMLLPLSATDKQEGASEAGRAAFRKLCEGMTVKQQTDLDIRRSILGNGSEVRRVTRDQIFRVFATLKTDPQAQKHFWVEYFGGPATSIAEFVRRQIILHGNLRDYAKTVGLSHMTLMELLKTRMLSFASLETLRAARVPFPWEKAVLHRQWRAMSCNYLQQREGLNVLGARVETLFAMRRPKVSRMQWVELGNLPKTLQGFPKSHVIAILSRARRGRTEYWEELDRVLVGMNCSLEERMEIAEAWLTTHSQPLEDEQTSGGRRRKNDLLLLRDDMEEGGEKEHPIPQSQVPYPEHLVGRESLAAIADIAAEFTGEADFRTLAEDETALAARVQQTLLNVDVFVARGKKEVRKPTDVVVAPRRRNPRTVRSDVIPIIGSSPRIVEQESATAAQETKERITDELIHERTRIASALQGMIQRREQSARSPQLQRIAGLLQGLVGRKEDDEEYYASLAPWMARIARSIDQMIDRERGSMYARERKKPEQNQAATQFSLPSLFEQTGEEERELHAETVFARIHGDERMREATRKRALRNIPHEPRETGAEDE